MNTLDDFLAVYHRLAADNLELLDRIYSADIEFCDPAHEIRGLDALRHYFAELYRNVDSISFSFGRTHRVGSEAYLSWRMSFRHPKLARGRTIEVDGLSYLKFNDNGKVSYHRDYFDLGAMLYEHLPLLGSLVKTIKRRLGT
ncbi:MAG: nuclear transport factor 2 family protein [Desulfofustis sp.]|nr:nuclear transport factor 2 family protein [Desulfofustis sp.]